MQKLTMEQAVVISGYTGVLACPFDELHREIEKRLGRPVWTHELGSRDLMENKIKPKFRDDFLSIIPANAELRRGSDPSPPTSCSQVCRYLRGHYCQIDYAENCRHSKKTVMNGETKWLCDLSCNPIANRILDKNQK